MCCISLSLFAKISPPPAPWPLKQFCQWSVSTNPTKVLWTNADYVYLNMLILMQRCHFKRGMAQIHSVQERVQISTQAAKPHICESQHHSSFIYQNTPYIKHGGTTAMHHQFYIVVQCKWNSKLPLPQQSVTSYLCMVQTHVLYEKLQFSWFQRRNTEINSIFLSKWKKFISASNTD